MAGFSHHSNYLLDQTVLYPNPQFHQPYDQPMYGHPHDQASVANKYLQSPDSSLSMVLDDQKVESSNELLPKKRKDKQVSTSLNNAQSKVLHLTTLQVLLVIFFILFSEI